MNVKDLHHQGAKTPSKNLILLNPFSALIKGKGMHLETFAPDIKNTKTPQGNL